MQKHGVIYRSFTLRGILSSNWHMKLIIMCVNKIYTLRK